MSSSSAKIKALPAVIWLGERLSLHLHTVASSAPRHIQAQGPHTHESICPTIGQRTLKTAQVACHSSANLHRALHTKAMAKAKTIVISGPMDAKHVGGVNILGNGVSSLSSYFNHSGVMPAEPSSSQGLDKTKHVEARGRSDTVPSPSGRPGLSLKQSFSRLRQKSFSPARHGGRDATAADGHGASQGEKTSSSPSGHLTAQSSTTLSRHKVGLDSDSDDTASITRGRTLAPQNLSDSHAETASISPDRRVPSRPPTSSSSSFIHFSMPNFDPHLTSSTVQRKPIGTPSRSRSPSQHSTTTSTTNPTHPPEPHRKAHRTDSGTAIDFKDVPVEERPVPFQEIMAVPSLQARMAMYKKTREYWATADHGLSEWVDQSRVPKPLVS